MEAAILPAYMNLRSRHLGATTATLFVAFIPYGFITLRLQHVPDGFTRVLHRLFVSKTRYPPEVHAHDPAGIS